MGALLTFSAFASGTTAIIKGLVKDEKGKPVNAATVTLYKAKDSALVKVAITDKDGIADFENISFGNYILKVSMINFQNYLVHCLPCS